MKPPPPDPSVRGLLLKKEEKVEKYFKNFPSFSKEGCPDVNRDGVVKV